MIFLLTLGVIIDGPFARASTALSLTASASTVAPGSTIDLTASMPVVSAGSTTQTLTQTIDPTKVKLTSANDITYPAGWTLSYSTDGTTFTSTAPTTTNGWAAITAVRATGSLESSGASNGFQVASRTATGTARSIAPSSITIAGTGDGYQAFFDPGRTRVFNVFHHQASGSSGQLDCYMIATGARCTGFPFDFSASKTPQSSLGRVVGNKIWIPGYKSGDATTQAVGFYCVDIASVLASSGSPSLCATPFVSMASGSSATVAFAGSYNEPALYNFYAVTGVGVSGSSSETKMWGVLSFNGNLVCIDTSTQSACAGMPTNGWTTGLSVGGHQGRGTDIEIWENRIYIRGNSANTDSSSRVVCRLASDPTQTCPGWSTPFSTTVLNEFVGELIPLPNSTGSRVSMCLGPDGRHTTLKFNSAMLETTTSNVVSCWDSNGVKSDGPASLSRLIVNSWSTNSSHGYLLDHSVSGNRIVWANGVNYGPTVTEAPTIVCWDAGLNGPCTTAALGTTTTANGSVTYSAANGFTGAGARNYTAVIDPIAPNCLWVMQDAVPRTFLLNVVDGTSNCTAGAPTTASFSGTSIVPRMGCEASSQPIRQWESFRLTSAGTGTFTAAKLTVKNSSGTAISGWTDVSLTLNTEVNLATLSPTDTGATPTFDVAFEGITGSITTASAQVRVVGDAPQLCTKVTSVYACPSGSGPIASLANNTATVSASGSSVLNSVTTTLTPASQSLTVTAPALSTCTSSITGRAGDAGGGASGSAIPGVTVSLLDSSGNPITVNGTPVTTTTASDGTYSFANLLPASYKIRFNEPSSQVLASSTVVSGASGTTTGAVTVNSAATTVTSNTAATIAGTNAVVNALYSIPAAATADVPPAGTQGTAQTIIVLTNDTAASGATLTASSVRLCGTSPVQSPPSCSQTSLTTADGTYSVNTTTGIVTFTPTSSFTGTATVIPSYQVSDSASNVVSSTITPSVIARPTLSPDTSAGSWDTNQTISPLANDTAGNGATLVASSVKLCAPSDTAPNCTATTLTNSDGTYTVNSDGTVTFNPVASFTGTSTNPVTYSVTDSLNQKSTSTITPSVSPPGAPVANPETKIVSPTQTSSFTTITGQGGLATGTQLSPSGTYLCALSPVQSPPNCNATTVTTADGTWVLSQITGVATYQPATGASAGTKIAITYQVTDPAGQSASALLTPVIPPAPVANPDTSSGQQGITQIISLTGNDQTGSASTPLDVSTVKFCVGNQVSPNCSATSLTITGQGSYSIDSLGIVTFTPVPSFTGTATPVDYQVSDSVGQTASSTLSIYVIPPPAPIATRDLGSAAYGQPVIFEPWKNDSGGDKPAGATHPAPDVIPTSIRLCSGLQAAPNCTATSIVTVDGTYNLDTATGKVTFTPVSGFSGTATAPVTYQISNNWTGPSGVATTTAILIPTIAAPGDPLATDDQSSTKPLTPVILKPVFNDAAGSYALNATTLRLCDATDIAPNCSKLSITNAHGTYVVDPNTGYVTFTPANGFKGLASVPYVISDMNARFAHANLFITVSQDSTQEITPANKANKTTKKNQETLAKTGTSGVYALGAIAILTGLTGIALVSTSQRKQTRI
jgi:CshA-type fibril repeat protein